MKINKNLYRWVTKQNHNLFIMGLITFTFPRMFIKSIYEHNSGRNIWNGKKACFTLSFDCDYPDDVAAVPLVLKFLSKYSFKASFACVGAWIEKFPDEHKMILDHGHEIVNHTYSHPDNELLNPGRRFRYISRTEKKEEIEKCHEICLKFLNYEPVGCRIPHFKSLFTSEIYNILGELGYKYSSSTWLTNTCTYGLPFFAPDNIIEFPVSVCPDHPFTVFDTWHSLNAKRISHRIKHRGPAKYFDLFKKLVKIGLETGSYLNIYMDPLDINNIQDFGAMIDILADENLRVETYEGYIKKKLNVEMYTT